MTSPMILWWKTFRVCVRDLRSLWSRRCVGGRIEVGMVEGRGYWAVGGWKEHWLRFVRSNQLICV